MIDNAVHHFTIILVGFLLGVLAINDPIWLSLVNATTPMFTLTCTSTGGPATTVTWTLDGSPQNGDTSQITSQLTATYSNTLTVTGRITGNYQCSVSNARSTAIQTLVVEGNISI